MASHSCFCFLRKGRKGCRDDEVKSGGAKVVTTEYSAAHYPSPGALKTVPSTASIGNCYHSSPENVLPSPHPLPISVPAPNVTSFLHPSSTAPSQRAGSAEGPRTPPPVPPRPSVTEARSTDRPSLDADDDEAAFLEARSLSAHSYTSSSYYSACGWSHFGDAEFDSVGRRISSIDAVNRATPTVNGTATGSSGERHAAEAHPLASSPPLHNHHYSPHRPSRGTTHLPALREAALAASGSAVNGGAAAADGSAVGTARSPSLEQAPSSPSGASSGAVVILAQASHVGLDALATAPAPQRASVSISVSASASVLDRVAANAAAVLVAETPIPPPPLPRVLPPPSFPPFSTVSPCCFRIPHPPLTLSILADDAYDGPPYWEQDASTASRANSGGGDVSCPVSGVSGSGASIVVHPQQQHLQEERAEEVDPERESLLDRVTELYGKLGRPCQASQSLLRYCKARGVAPESLAAGLAARRVPNAAILPKFLRNVADALSDLGSEAGWQLVRADDFRLLYRHLPPQHGGGGLHAFRAVCTLDAPTEQLVALAREVDLFPSWNKYCSAAHVLRQTGPGDMRVYMSLWMPWPFSDVGFCVEAGGLDLLEDEGCIMVAVNSPERKDRTTPLPLGSEKHIKIRLLRPSCLSFTPLPPAAPGGPPRTHCHVQAYVDTGGRHVPALVISFVLKVFSPFMFGTVKKVLASAFSKPDGPLPTRMRQNAPLYDMVRRRSEAYLAARKAAEAAAAAGAPRPMEGAKVAAKTPLPSVGGSASGAKAAAAAAPLRLQVADATAAAEAGVAGPWEVASLGYK